MLEILSDGSLDNLLKTHNTDAQTTHRLCLNYDHMPCSANLKPHICPHKPACKPLPRTHNSDSSHQRASAAHLEVTCIQHQPIESNPTATIIMVTEMISEKIALAMEGYRRLRKGASYPRAVSGKMGLNHICVNASKWNVHLHPSVRLLPVAVLKELKRLLSSRQHSWGVTVGIVVAGRRRIMQGARKLCTTTKRKSFPRLCESCEKPGRLTCSSRLALKVLPSSMPRGGDKKVDCAPLAT